VVFWAIGVWIAISRFCPGFLVSIWKCAVGLRLRVTRLLVDLRAIMTFLEPPSLMKSFNHQQHAQSWISPNLFL
jgi:hypothetical protein